jgi:hypothetical protein
MTFLHSEIKKEDPEILMLLYTRFNALNEGNG